MGHISIQLNARDGIIQGAAVYSDAMDWLLPKTVEAALAGCRFETDAMKNAFRASDLEPQICADLCQALDQQHL